MHDYHLDAPLLRPDHAPLLRPDPSYSCQVERPHDLNLSLARRWQGESGSAGAKAYDSAAYFVLVAAIGDVAVLSWDLLQGFAERPSWQRISRTSCCAHWRDCRSRQKRCAMYIYNIFLYGSGFSSRVALNAGRQARLGCRSRKMQLAPCPSPPQIVINSDWLDIRRNT